MDIDVQADDAAALIAAVGAPAYVFGTSGGAQIGSTSRPAILSW